MHPQVMEVDDAWAGGGIIAGNVPTEVLLFRLCSPFHIRADHGEHLFQGGRLRGNHLAYLSYVFVMRKFSTPGQCAALSQRAMKSPVPACQ